MKTLTKIKLINWHMFDDKLIHIHGNILLTGENGSGKSTLIDAMQYILTAGTAKFNMAANDSAKRDLKAYIRGKLGIEGHEYLRMGDVTTHIALEYYDEKTNVYQILGGVFELKETQQLTERFYVMHNVQLVDTFFSEALIVRRWHEFRTYCEKKETRLTWKDRKSEAKVMFRQALGVEGKYFDLIPKALAFKPINELNDFIFNFLLIEDNIKIDNLRENIRKYREFDKELKKQQKNLVFLSEIERTYKSYCDGKELIRQVSLLLVHTKAQKYITRQQENEQLIATNTGKVEQWENKNKMNEMIRNQLYEDYRKLDQHCREHDGYKRLKMLENEQEQVVKESIGLKVKYERLLHDATVMQEIGKKLECKLIDLDTPMSELIALPKQLEAVLQKLNEELSAKQVTALTEHVNIEKNIISYTEQLKKLGHKKEMLEKKRFSYPQEVERLIQVLNEALTHEFGEPIIVKPFCEYLEITDPAWRDAVEGFLHKQRFNLLIEPRHFQKAMQIYEQEKDRKSLYGVAIVDCEKLDAFAMVEENTLAEKVKASTEYARNYANLLLNSVKCVGSVAELKQYKRSITKTCMIYSHFSVRALHPKRYQAPYIGKQAVEIQLKSCQNEYKIQQDKKRNYEVQQQKVQSILKDTQKNLCTSLVRDVDVIDHYTENQAQLLRITQQLEDLSKDPSFVTLEGQRQELQERMVQNQQQMSEIERTIGQLQQQIETGLKYLETTKSECKQAIELWQKDRAKYPDYIKDVEADYQQLTIKHRNNFKLMISTAEHRRGGAIEKNQKQSFDVIDAMKAFNEFTQLGFQTSIDEIMTYMEQLISLQTVELEASREAVRIAQKKCEMSFQEVFISQLREKIKMAQANLKKLNSHLKEKIFSGERYEFVFKPSSSVSHREYYDIIMSKEDYSNENLFVSSLTDKNRQIMNDLFDKLSSVDDESQNENILQQYVDYRYYMSYDIKITNRQNEVTFFSKVNKEKSGGETQTPFYVIIASSFEQLIKYNSQEDSGCIVLFDEAFNNMDENRINAMMQFYHDLSIQIVIAVPPIRIQTIIPYIDTVITLIKDEHQVYVKEFVKDVNAAVH